MQLGSRLAALLVALARPGYAQGTGGSPYAPYSREDHGIRPEHGGGNGGGGGGM